MMECSVFTGRSVCTVPFGLEVKEAPDAVSEVKSALDGYARMTADGFKKFTEHAESTRQQFNVIDERLLDIEQKAARASMGGPITPRTWGSHVVEGQEFKGWMGSGARGTIRISVKGLDSSATSAGAMIYPDRDPNVVLMAKRRLSVRALLAPGRTGSNAVEYVRQTGYANAAAPVAERALKPESDITFEALSTPVRTIAHWVPVSRQAMDDAPGLASLIDGELRYGLAYAEEVQLLLGDGNGQNLHGLIPQATAYDTTRTKTGDTAFDVIHHAIAQAEVAELPASGIILNTQDWMDLFVIKDGEGRYIGPGPFGAAAASLWTLPVTYSNAMPVGKFLVGAFGTAAQVYDRLDPEVLVSDQDRDNFVKNMLTVRAEERLAMAVKRPEALIYGKLSGSA